MSDKKVIVIDYDDFYKAWLALTQEQRTYFVCVESALKRSSPAPLLASFERYVYKSDLQKKDSDLILFHTPPITKPDKRQKVTVLILGGK